MDLTKFALYTVLAVITYLMLLAWQDDYPPLIEDSSSVVTPSRLTEPEVQRNPDVPTNLPTNPEGSAIDSSVLSTPFATTRELITVTTDTLKLTIDLNGGDIVELALPKYLKQLNVPDDPFVILESNLGRTYIAQSGLIGQNGIDNSGRAIYQSASNSYQLQNDEESLSIDLVTSPSPDINVTKRYTFHKGTYLIDLEFLIDNLDNNEELPDVIFLDINMPIMDGFQFMEEYARIKPKLNKKITIYMVSSSVDPVDMERAKNITEISDYIIKPIKAGQLQEIMANL